MNPLISKLVPRLFPRGSPKTAHLFAPGGSSPCLPRLPLCCPSLGSRPLVVALLVSRGPASLAASPGQARPTFVRLPQRLRAHGNALGKAAKNCAGSGALGGPWPNGSRAALLVASASPRPGVLSSNLLRPPGPTASLHSLSPAIAWTHSPPKSSRHLFLQIWALRP